MRDTKDIELTKHHDAKELNDVAIACADYLKTRRVGAYLQLYIYGVVGGDISLFASCSLPKESPIPHEGTYAIEQLRAFIAGFWASRYDPAADVTVTP